MEVLLPSSSSGISPKISTILQSYVYPRFGRVLRALARVKSALVDACSARPSGARGGRGNSRSTPPSAAAARRRRGAAATAAWRTRGPPHLAWSGGGGGLSPAPRTAAEVALDVDYHVVYPSYESVWNAVVVPTAAPGEYCGYLRWLEEEIMQDEVVVVEEEEDGGEEDADADVGNEIDRLAEQFIARCRAKFLLEKQESYDRCQEMIAMSL